MLIQTDLSQFAGLHALKDVDLASLIHLGTKITPIQDKLKIVAALGPDNMPVELLPHEIPGAIGERYRECWGKVPRDQLIVLTDGKRVKNGRAVGCTGLYLDNGEVVAKFEGVPYYSLLAAKEILSCEVLFPNGLLPQDISEIDPNDSIAAGQSQWGPAIAGGSVAVLAKHEGRNVLVTQIKGDKVLNGGKIHPYCFAGGLKQSELHLGIVQLELGTYREFIEEGGDDSKYRLSRTIGVVDEGNPPHFRSFNHALQRKDSQPIWLEEFIHTVMIPYTLNTKPSESPENLEVRGWHIIDIDRPSLESSSQGIFSTGVSYLIDKDVSGNRVLREVFESRPLVEPVGGVLFDILIKGSGYRNLLLHESNIAA